MQYPFGATTAVLRGCYRRNSDTVASVFPALRKLQDNVSLTNWNRFLEIPCEVMQPGMSPHFELESYYCSRISRGRRRGAQSNVVIQFKVEQPAFRKVLVFEFIIVPQLIDGPGMQPKHFLFLSEVEGEIRFVAPIRPEDFHGSPVMLYIIIRIGHRVCDFIEEHNRVRVRFVLRQRTRRRAANPLRNCRPRACGRPKKHAQGCHAENPI